MQIRNVIFLLTGLLSGVISSAQKIDSMLAVYHDNYQQEKLHLHLDKSVYAAGETIWYKAYILAGENPSDYTRNFFVDWYDQNGHLIKHTIHPVFESSARGQFAVPAGYTGEMLHLKAYTRWMLNFDTSFVYTKNIRIIGMDTAVKKTHPSPATTFIHFFPESGDLVDGVSSTVAFMAVNQAGDPVSVRGAVFNARHELIDSFASAHDGMGSFSLESSIADSYTCGWIDEYGTSHTTALPAVKKTGVVLESRLLDKKIIFAVKRSANIPAELKNLHLVATSHQQMVYSASVNLSSKKISGGEVPALSLPSGVLQLTLFDANWIPVAERVIFIKNSMSRFQPEIRMTTSRFGRRARNEMEITVEDTLLSNLSVSVTDASVFTEQGTNIISDLLLQGDVKGRVADAAYYFADNGAETNKFLDLVMLTHGWRKYNWEDIVKGITPRLAYPVDSDYVQIRGKVMANGQATIKPGQTIALVMQGKDNGKQYFMLPLKPNGTFTQRGIIFFDTAKVFYQLGDKRLNDVAIVNFQYGLPLVPYAGVIRVPVIAGPDSVQLRNSALFYSTQRKKVDAGFTLEEVTVDSKIKSQVELLDEKYTTGLFNSKNSYAFDVMTDDRTRGQLDVFHYLQNVIPGLSMSLPVLGTNGAEDANSNNVPGLNWRDGTPDIFINEMPSDAGRAMAISMSDIAYIKVFKPPFMASAGSGASGAIAIYTRKGNDMDASFVRGLNSAIISGYTPYKEFYNPDYSVSQTKLPDSRATIYWNPYVLTDKKMKTVKLSFYNNDVSKKFRIVLEGMNAAGKLARIEKIVE